MLKQKIAFTLVAVLFLGFFFTKSNAQNISLPHKPQLSTITPLATYIVYQASPLRFFITPTPTVIPQSKEKIQLSPTPQPVQTGYCITVPVLMYHHVQPGSLAIKKGQTALSVDSLEFEGQMKYLMDNGYTIISAQDLVHALVNKTEPPHKSIVITLDDGYKDAYEYAFPVFRKYNIKATLMIAPGLLEGGDFLSWAELKEMVSSGIIFITNHTWSHFPLAAGNEEKISHEVTTAKSELEKNLGQTVPYLTYPYGSFSPFVIEVVKKLGIQAAFSSIQGKVQCDSSLMTIHRTRIGNGPLSFYGL